MLVWILKFIICFNLISLQYLSRHSDGLRAELPGFDSQQVQEIIL
jgi:hypothetical protein